MRTTYAILDSHGNCLTDHTLERARKSAELLARRNPGTKVEIMATIEAVALDYDTDKIRQIEVEPDVPDYRLEARAPSINLNYTMVDADLDALKRAGVYLAEMHKRASDLTIEIKSEHQGLLQLGLANREWV